MTPPLHIIICGGRDFRPLPNDEERLVRWLSIVAPAVVHHGDARGADRWAAGVAAKVPGVTVVAHPADWDKHRRTSGRNPAGPIRNRSMLYDVIAAGGDERPVVMAYPGGTWDQRHGRDRDTSAMPDRPAA